VSGDFNVKNLDAELLVSVVRGDAALENAGDITVEMINGDLFVRNVNGPLMAGEVMGDMALRNVGDFRVGKVYGDCAASNVNGTATIGEVMGDINLRTVNGTVAIEKSNRDVNLRNLGEVATVAQAHGDIRLRGGLASGKHSFTADGDIVVRWPIDAAVHIDARAAEILNELPLKDVVDDGQQLTGSLGEGETFLILAAGGRIILKEAQPSGKSWKSFPDEDLDFEVDLSGLGDQIAEEINSRMTEWTARIETKFGPEYAAKIERKAQAAAARAEEAAERAIRKAEKAAQKARWQMERRMAPTPVKPVQKAIPKEKLVTEEEQLKILRMVEKGIISPEEADTLLSAIEG